MVRLPVVAWVLCAGSLLVAQGAGSGSVPGDKSGGKDAKATDLQALLNVQIVSASKFAQGSGEAPATVVVITQEQIRQRGYRALNDVFKDLPDFKVESRSDPEWYNNYTVRGVPGHDKFVILLDGQKISGPTNEQLPIMENFPVNMLSQIEVVYGPASALYGADAVSGVINLISAPAWYSSSASIRGGGDGYRLGNFFYTKAFTNDLELAMSGQWSQDDQPDLASTWPDQYQAFDPQRAGQFQSIFGPFSPTGYDPTPAYPNRTRAVYASLKKDSLRLTVFTNYGRFSSGTTYTPQNAIYDEGTFIGHGETSIGLSHSLELGGLTLQSSLTSQEYQLDPGSNFRNAFTGFAAGYKYADSSAVRAEEQAVWRARTDLTVTGGATFETFRATPWSTDLQTPVNPDGAVSGTILGTSIPADFFTLRYHNLGFYAQAQYAAAPTLSLTLGGRYDDNSRFGSTWNPRLGAIWSPTSTQTLKLLFGTAFLAPSPYTAFGYYGSFYPTGSGSYASNFWKLPNPGLKPMKSRNLELNYRWFFTPEVSLTATAFYTQLDDLFALVDDSQYTHLYHNTYKGYPVAYIAVQGNLGEQKNHGGTLQLNYLRAISLGQVSAYLAWSYVDGQVDEQGNGVQTEIGQVAPQIVRAGLEGNLGDWTFSLRGTHVGTQRTPVLEASGSRETLGGYTTVDLNLRWEFVPGYTAELTASNVTYARYLNINGTYDPTNPAEFPGTPQDPRRVFLGFEAKF